MGICQKDTKQLKVKRDLEHGHYEEQQQMSRSEYVIQLYNQVTLLDEPPVEQVVVKSFSRHFDEQVHSAVLAQGIKTITGFIDLLDSLDQAGSLNRVYSQTNSSSSPASNKKSPQRYASSYRQYNNSPSYTNNNYTKRDSSPHNYGNKYDTRFKSKNDMPRKVSFDSEVSEKIIVDSDSDGKAEN